MNKKRLFIVLSSIAVLGSSFLQTMGFRDVVFAGPFGIGFDGYSLGFICFACGLASAGLALSGNFSKPISKLIALVIASLGIIELFATIFAIFHSVNTLYGILDSISSEYFGKIDFCSGPPVRLIGEIGTIVTGVLAFLTEEKNSNLSSFKSGKGIKNTLSNNGYYYNQAPNPAQGNNRAFQPQNPAQGNNQAFQPQNPVQGNNQVFQSQNPAQGSNQAFQPQNPVQGNNQVFQSQNPMQGNNQVFQSQNPMQGNNQAFQSQNPAQGNNQAFQPQNPAQGNNQALQSQNPAQGNNQALQSQHLTQGNNQAFQPQNPVQGNNQVFQSQNPMQGNNQAFQPQNPAQGDRQQL
ncbi:hypothetical protein [Streptococcus salivarius]